VDGGATANDLLMQLQADLAGTALLRPQVLETTALGAAFFAGLATGVWESVDQLRALRSEGARFVPQMEETERARLLRGWRRAVQRAKAWAREEEQASP
jgi:glycerol kinase